MFFGFQTPASEYAQALVDFHHYAFFFFILVTIFVIWMIKFSLFFVIEEKNFTFFSKKKTSDFFFIENNKWIKKGGEFSFLFSQISYVIFSQSSILKKFLEKIPFYVFTSNFINSMFKDQITLIQKINVKSYTYVKSIFQKTEIFGFINRSGYNTSFLLDNKGVNYFKTFIKNNNIKDSSLLFNLSLIPSYMISQVKVGYGATRFSEWTWKGEYQDLFVFFNGLGDNYPFNLEEYGGIAFDENLNMPQAFDLSNFYAVDLWQNPFLFFQNVRHRIVLEWVWTFIPTLILVILVIPSLYLLYSYDKPYVTAPYLTFKAVGHQWYWSYEYCDFNPDKEGNLNFDSYMLHENDLTLGQLRLLEVDRRVVLPAGVCIRMLTTSADVLHSWAVPAFGVKMDSVPGRLNQFWLVLNKPGVFYGQCSEICGVNHGFMPIAVEVVYLDQYLEFILSKISE